MDTAKARGHPDPLVLDAERVIEQVRDEALFLIDTRGRIASWNEGVGEILGWTAQDWVGQPLQVAFTPDDVRQGVPQAEMAKAADSGHSDDSRWMRRQNGEQFFALGSMTRMCDPQGRLVGYLKALRDFTAPQRAQARLEHLLSDASQARDWAERQSASVIAALDAMADGVLIGDRQGIHQCNAAARHLLGIAGLQALQTDAAGIVELLRLRPERDGPLLPAHELPFQVAQHGKTLVRELWASRSNDGQDVFLRCAAAPIRIDGHAVGMVAVLSDLGPRLATQTAEQPAADPEPVSPSRVEFLSTLSHELRTPLSAMLGWAQVLERGMFDPDTLQQGLSAISRNARLQAQLIENLLDMNRIELGQLRLDLQAVRLVGVVTAAVDAAMPAARAKGVALHALLGTVDIDVRGDRSRLLQVVGQLLGNAIKFTPQGGRIDLSLSRVDGQARLTVADNGQGIDTPFLPRVFGRLQQQDGRITRRQSGLGIGLAIVRHLVQLHQGAVHVHSPGVGQGATFTVLLPCEAAPTAERLRDDVSAPALTVAPAAVTNRLAGVCVLIVDDTPDVQAITARLLQDAGATVLQAEGALQALRLLRRQRPDLILSDIGMPDIDGYELMRRVRRLAPDHGGNTPAVALTAYTRVEDVAKALDAGYQRHLAKPVSPVDLIATLASLLAPDRPQGQGAHPAP